MLLTIPEMLNFFSWKVTKYLEVGHLSQLRNPKRVSHKRPLTTEVFSSISWVGKLTFLVVLFPVSSDGSVTNCPEALGECDESPTTAQVLSLANNDASFSAQFKKAFSTMTEYTKVGNILKIKLNTKQSLFVSEYGENWHLTLTPKQGYKSIRILTKSII